MTLEQAHFLGLGYMSTEFFEKHLLVKNVLLFLCDIHHVMYAMSHTPRLANCPTMACIIVQSNLWDIVLGLRK